MSTVSYTPVIIHPCYDQSRKLYICPCGYNSKKKPLFNQHVYICHSQEEAFELMDWITYQQYYTGK